MPTLNYLLSYILAEVNKDANDLKCYVHTLSPVKVAASGKCKYFNMTLQTSEGCKSAVCFSPDKRPTFEKHHGDKILLKSSNSGLVLAMAKKMLLSKHEK